MRCGAALLALLLSGGCAVPAPEAAPDNKSSKPEPAPAPLARGFVPFVWPRAGVITRMTCRFETARPIGVFAASAAPEEATALARVLRAFETGGLGVRFIDAPLEDAQIHVAFGVEPLALGARSVSDCKLTDEHAELAAARVEVARSVALRRGATRALAREELLGVLARELARALGYAGEAPARDPIGSRSLAEAKRVGAALRDGAALDSPALRALYARASGSLVGSVAAEPPSATRPVDRLAQLAQTHRLDGPYLRTSADSARVYWRDAASGEEYGAQVLEPARLERAPARIALALEPRARRALPRSRDAPR